MSVLEQLGIQTKGLEETVKPFEPWKGSPIQNWSVVLHMLNIGELADIAKLTADTSPMEAIYLSKVYLLAKAIKKINNYPLVTEEDVEEYNESHDLTGMTKLNMFGYKVLFIKKLSEAIVNRLAFMYDEMQNKYIQQLLGRPLPDALNAAKVGDVDLSKIDKIDKKKEDELNASTESPSTAL